MRLGNAEEARKAKLTRLLTEACRRYIREVGEQHKLYDHFADDFINLHRYTDCRCALGRNSHSTNLHIVKEILTTRKDLVYRYFVDESPSQEQMESMVRDYDTTTPPIRESPRHSIRSDIVLPTFRCYFDQKEISLITHYAYEAFLFKGNYGEPEIKALFSCSLQKPLQVRNNRVTAVFFDELSRKRLICREWQEVIEINYLLESSTGTKLTAHKLSSALSQSHDNDISYRPKFTELAKELHTILSTDVNEDT